MIFQQSFGDKLYNNLHFLSFYLSKTIKKERRRHFIKKKKKGKDME